MDEEGRVEGLSVVPGDCRSADDTMMAIAIADDLIE